jgi:hypothetical protein
MSKPDHSDQMPSRWLNVFNNSKSKGGNYRSENLPSHTWLWPTDTFFQRRLRAVRANAAVQPVIVAQNSTLRQSTPKEVDAAPQAAAQRTTIANPPVDNATRPTSNSDAATGKGLVIEWEDIDERLAWFARPSNN